MAESPYRRLQAEQYRLSIGDALKRIVALGKGDIWAIAPISAHPGDYYLWVVLIDTGRELVVWDYNAQDNGAYNGFYTQSGPDALKEFKKRIRS